MKKDKRSLTVKMTLSTVLSGGRRGAVRRKKWSVKKKITPTSLMPRKLRVKLKRFMKTMGLMSILIVFAAVLSLSGCGGYYTEPEDTVTVSAMGFDLSESGVRVSLQSVTDGKSTDIISGEGESVSFALAHLSGEKPTELSHCALIVIGDGMGKERLTEIFELCREKREIGDTVLIAATHDAKALLSLDGAVGYDVVGSMRAHPESAGLFSKNRFYELWSEYSDVMALPYFHVSEDSYTLGGLKIYRGLNETVLLDRREGALYLMAKGIFTSGSLDFLDGDIARSVPIKRAVTTYETGRRLTVSCVLTADVPLSHEEKEALVRSCSEGSAELYNRLSELYGNLFGFSEDTGGCDFVFTVEDSSS